MAFTPASVNLADHFSFEAELIGLLNVGGTSIPLKAGAHNDKVNVGATTLNSTLMELLHPVDRRTWQPSTHSAPQG